MRFWIATIAAAVVGLLLPSGAAASFHLMKVSEVYVDTADPNVSYVELQMHADGQNQVSGHTLSVYSQAGTDAVVTLPASVANGDSQRSILIASQAAFAQFDGDFSGIPGGFLETAGGAVCFETIDCMSWGNYSGTTKAPAGTPAAPMTTGRSLERSIAPGCETLLEAGDDSDDSAADFSSAVPSPRNNASEPSERVCTGPGPGPGDSSVDGAELRAKRSQRQSGRRQVIRVRLACAEDTDVKAAAEIKAAGKTYKLRASTELIANEPLQLKLKTKGRDGRKIARALDSGARVKAKLKARFRDAAGNTAVEKTTVRLK